MGNTAHEPIVTENPTGEMGPMIREMLEEHFEDLFVFKPIVVEVKTGHDDQDYLNAHIVLDRDFDNPDPGWTMDLPEKLWSCTNALGYPGIPIQSFVAKSEWKTPQRMLR